jgi:hypothetical protein
MASGLAAAILPSSARADTQLPVPTWIPSFEQPREQIVDRMRYYFDGKADFVVMTHGTCVVLDHGLSDEAARSAAVDILQKIINYHPDMAPHTMDDGNVLVGYDHPAYNVVLNDVAAAHWPEIESRHKDGLTPDEVLITPQGNNVFDDFGKKALLGRAYMFRDALDPKPVAIVRHAAG